MKLIRLNYALLALSMALSILSNANPTTVAVLEPWLSIASLGLLILVAVDLHGKDKRMLGERAHRHAQAQKRVLLLFVASGVLASFQWILFFRQLTIGIDLNLVLQLTNWLLFIVAAGHVIVGAALSAEGWLWNRSPAAQNSAKRRRRRRPA